MSATKFDEIPEDLRHYYEPGLIKWEDKDEYWSRKIPEFAASAGIEERWIYRESIFKHCGEGETAWLRQFHFKKHDGESGMALVRASKSGKVDIIDRMAAMTGLFIRNGVHAKLMTVTQIMDHVVGGDPIRATVLLCPNMFPKSDQALVSAAMASRLHDMLMQRSQRGTMTIFYTVPLDALSKSFGNDLADFVENHFTVVEL